MRFSIIRGFTPMDRCVAKIHPVTHVRPVPESKLRRLPYVVFPLESAYPDKHYELAYARLGPRSVPQVAWFNTMMSSACGCASIYPGPRGHLDPLSLSRCGALALASAPCPRQRGTGVWATGLIFFNRLAPRSPHTPLSSLSRPHVAWILSHGAGWPWVLFSIAPVSLPRIQTQFGLPPPDPFLGPLGGSRVRHPRRYSRCVTGYGIVALPCVSLLGGRLPNPESVDTDSLTPLRCAAPSQRQARSYVAKQGTGCVLPVCSHIHGGTRGSVRRRVSRALVALGPTTHLTARA